MRDCFVTPLGPLLFDRLPFWLVISWNTQIMRNQELISVDLGGDRYRVPEFVPIYLGIVWAY